MTSKIKSSTGKATCQSCNISSASAQPSQKQSSQRQPDNMRRRRIRVSAIPKPLNSKKKDSQLPASKLSG